MARLEREQRKQKRGGEDVFGEVVAVVDAASAAVDDEAEDGRLEIEGNLPRRCVGAFFPRISVVKPFF